MSYAININDARDILELADLKRDQIVPCLVGPPGIGKTQTVYEFARKHGRDVVEMILSQRLPTEISGLVMPDTDNKSMEVFDHSRLSSLKDGDILLFDELLEAPPMVLSACLTLIQERRLMSGKKLPDIMIVAATNPLASPSISKLSLRQRFMWLEIEFDFGIWSNWVNGKLGVEISGSSMIRNVMAMSGENYNVMTPRTATKLLELGLAARKKGENSFWNFQNMVKAMFDGGVKNALCEIIEHKPSAKKQILNALADFNREYPVMADIDLMAEDEKLRECSVAEMMEILSKSSCWDSLSKYLEQIDLE